MAIKTFSYSPGLAAQLFAVWRDATGQYWNALTAAFEAYNASNWTATKYLLACTEPGKASEYQTTIPAMAAGSYTARIMFTPASGSPSAVNDFAVMGSATVAWSGTAEVTPIGSATIRNVTDTDRQIYDVPA